MTIKHIVIFSRSLPLHGIGGMEIVAWDLAKEFQKKGFEVTCITTSLNGYQDVMKIDGVNVIALNNVPSGKYSSQWFQYSSDYFLNNFNKSDVVVLSVSAAAAGLLRKKDKIKIVAPIIFQAHGTSIGEIKSKWRTWKLKPLLSSVRNFVWFFKDINLYKASDAIVAVGDKVYDDLSIFPNTLAKVQTKTHLIRNGIDTQLFSYSEKNRKILRDKLDVGNNTKVIISASRLHKQKGVHLGLLGFAEYLKNNPASIYIIIGNGPEQANLKILAEHLNINDSVIFTSSLNRDKIVEYLNVGDLFLFTTLRDEGLPLNALEALSSGLKVIISSHIEGITSIDKDAVIPVDPKSPKEIAKALQTMPDKNRKSYLPRKYSLEYCANKYIELFKDLYAKEK